MAKTLYIADLHFGHKNCLVYDNRPFSDIDTHDQSLIERWNSVVGADDTVWVLGDFSWCPASRTISIFSQLNGTKRLVIGNHDRKLIKDKNVCALFAEIVNYKEIKLGNNIGLVLCHYPIPCFNRHIHGWVHLYGHVHSSIEWNIMERDRYLMESLYEMPCNMYNVGCMIPYMDYTPRTLDEIIKANKRS